MITRRQVTIKYRSGKYRSELERPVTWVALVGFMGSGKSRIGAELSRKLHLNFIDTDRVVERVSCMKIPDIFELYGEATFRDYESEIVRRSCRLDDAIVSTGGGTVVRPQNREALKERGPVILLTASAETTFQRTRRHKRPLLEVGNPIERINDLMAARKGFYEDVASFSVSTDGRPSFEVVEEIIERLYHWKQEQDQHQMLKATEEQMQALHGQNSQSSPDNQSNQNGLNTVNTQDAEGNQQIHDRLHFTDLQQASRGIEMQSQHQRDESSASLDSSPTATSHAESPLEGELSLQEQLDQQTRIMHVQAHVRVQQVLLTEQSTLNIESSEVKFSDKYFTESTTESTTEFMEAEVELDCLAEEQGENGEKIVKTLDSEQTDLTSPKQKSEADDTDSPGRDIYAEMIRDLMRDPRA